MSYIKQQFDNEYLEDDFTDDDFQFYVEMKHQQMKEEQEYILDMLCKYNLEQYDY